jgi:hypothetical protein
MELAGVGAMGLGHGFEDQRGGNVITFAAIESEGLEKGGAACPAFRQFRVRRGRSFVVGLLAREQFKDGSIHRSKSERGVAPGQGLMVKPPVSV